jgi:hypothetical protein
MAVVETLVDDLDGGVATGTTSFSINGYSYQIDLSEGNYGLLMETLKPYLVAARSVPGATAARRPRTASKHSSAKSVESAAVRAWWSSDPAHEPRLTATRGRIPSVVRTSWELLSEDTRQEWVTKMSGA